MCSACNGAWGPAVIPSGTLPPLLRYPSMNNEPLACDMNKYCGGCKCKHCSLRHDFMAKNGRVYWGRVVALGFSVPDSSPGAGGRKDYLCTMTMAELFPQTAKLVPAILPPQICIRCKFKNDFAGPEHLTSGEYICRSCK